MVLPDKRMGTAAHSRLRAQVEGGQVNKDGANPPGDPTKISPQKDAVRVGLGLGAQGGDAVVLPAFSYVVVEYGGAR